MGKMVTKLLHALLPLAIALALVAATAAAGGAFTGMSVRTWYPTLAKPTWTPPGQVIGSVWTVLYFLMAVAAYTVWLKGKRDQLPWPIGLFVVQLVFNAGWSFCFFGLQSPGLAFAEILVLLTLVIATMVCFFRVSALGGLLLVPYAAWVTFAAFLNLTIWRMNP